MTPVVSMSSEEEQIQTRTTTETRNTGHDASFKRPYSESEDEQNVDFYSNILYTTQPKRTRASTTHNNDAERSKKNSDQPSRTVYLGGLPPDTTFKEIFDIIKVGPVESVRLLPEKDCAFIDFCVEADASAFRLKFRGKRLNIRGVDIKVAYAKPSHSLDNVLLATKYGATRNIYLAGITGAEDPEGHALWETKLRVDCERFGPIDMIKIVPERNIAFVHMARISDAMEAVSWLSGDPAWSGKRINFGSDRCHGRPADRPSLDNKLCRRTVYLGGLVKGVTLEDICEVVRGGLLDQVKLIEEKSAAFVTFVRPEDAESYYQMTSSDGLCIKGNRVKVSWASDRALSVATIHALQKGATRCVCIENIDHRAYPLATLTKDFEERFGDIETSWKGRQADRANTVFISFACIKDAVSAVDSLRHDRVFSGCRISYSRDRCSAPATTSMHKSIHYPVSVPHIQLPHYPYQHPVYPSYPSSFIPPFPSYSYHEGGHYAYPPPPPQHAQNHSPNYQYFPPPPY